MKILLLILASWFIIVSIKPDYTPLTEIAERRVLDEMPDTLAIKGELIKYVVDDKVAYVHKFEDYKIAMVKVDTYSLIDNYYVNTDILVGISFKGNHTNYKIKESQIIDFEMSLAVDDYELMILELMFGL